MNLARTVIAVLLAASTAADGRDLELADGDRVLIIAPHPEKAALACAGVIQQAASRGIPVRVVSLTHGENSSWSFSVYRRTPIVTPRAVINMGIARGEEAVASGQALGLDPNEIIFFGYPDSGLMELWREHWGKRPVYRGVLSRATEPPYDNVFRPGAPYRGESLLRDLSLFMRVYQPTRVFVSHPADRDPDHQAAYLFTRVALWELENRLTAELLPYLIHESPGDRPDVAWRDTPLAPAEQRRKRSAIEAYRTLLTQNPDFLYSFFRGNERFGDYETVRMSPRPVPLDADRPDKTPPTELTESEREDFVGIRRRVVHAESNAVVMAVTLTRPIPRRATAVLYLFGFRPDVGFDQMPKLQVRLGINTQRVYNGNRLVPTDTIEIAREDELITVRIPLDRLNNPDRMLTAVHTCIGDVPLDSAPWRVLEPDDYFE